MGPWGPIGAPDWSFGTAHSLSAFVSRRCCVGAAGVGAVNGVPGIVSVVLHPRLGGPASGGEHDDKRKRHGIGG